MDSQLRDRIPDPARMERRFAGRDTPLAGLTEATPSRSDLDPRRRLGWARRLSE